MPRNMFLFNNAIYLLPYVPRTTKEIFDRIGVSMHSKNRERYITSLVAAGYLQMTNPDNPTASNQKYKKVNKR